METVAPDGVGGKEEEEAGEGGEHVLDALFSVEQIKERVILKQS